METLSSSETSLYLFQTIRRDIPVHVTFHSLCCYFYFSKHRNVTSKAVQPKRQSDRPLPKTSLTRSYIQQAALVTRSPCINEATPSGSPGALGSWVSQFNTNLYEINSMFIKSKATPVTGLEGLQGCEMLRIPHCLDKRITDGDEIVSLTHRQRSTPQKHYFSASGTHFCWRLSKPQGHGADGRIR
jgi:hypothetical protein